MAGVIHIFRRQQNRRNRVFQERFDPLEQFDDDQLFLRYRFRRADIIRIVELIRNDLVFVYNRRGSLSPEMQVLLALRFYATGGFQNLVGDTVHVHRSTISRIIQRVTAALCRKARDNIHFPCQQEANRQKRQFHTLSGFPNVIGCVDGTQIAIVGPTRNEHEFVNRRGKHSINIQVICDSDLRLLNCVVKHPGSVHDARILRESSVWRHFEQQPKLLDGVILGDSAYPLRDWLMTPFLNAQTRGERRYNSCFKTARATVERCIGVIKRRFHCLHTELRYTPQRACRIITACLVLHNLAVQFGTPEPDEYDFHNDEGDNDQGIMEPTQPGRVVRQQIVTRFG